MVFKWVSTKVFFSDIGNGWKLAVLDTKEEYDFIEEGQRSFSNNYHYWIGGSANATINSEIGYDRYIIDNSGNYHNNIVWMYLTSKIIPC